MPICMAYADHMPQMLVAMVFISRDRKVGDYIGLSCVWYRCMMKGFFFILTMFLDLTFVHRRVMENSLWFPNANSIQNK